MLDEDKNIDFNFRTIRRSGKQLVSCYSVMSLH